MNLEHAELLYAALQSPLGIVVETDNTERLRQRLYAARKESEEFVGLSFVISPMNGLDLWIVKRNPDAEE